MQHLVGREQRVPKKTFNPFNGSGIVTDGLLIILTAQGQSQGYLWEGSYPGGGTPLPPKTIESYFLGVNDVQVYLQRQGTLKRSLRPLSADWKPFQNMTESWVNYYGNETVNLSLDSKSVQAVTNLIFCREHWGSWDSGDLEAAQIESNKKTATVAERNILPFNGGPQKITCLMIHPEPPRTLAKAFFWEQPIDSGVYGQGRALRMRSHTSNASPSTDHATFTLFVGIGASPQSSVLYRPASALALDLAAGEGDIYVNFYSSNMTVNISRDGKNAHAWSNLVPA